MIRQMPFKLPLILSIVVAVFKDRADLVAENIALRHQLSCFIHRGRRPKLRPVDRVFWVLLSRFWDGWRKRLVMVKPATSWSGIARASGSSGDGKVENVVLVDLEFPPKFVG